MADEDVIEVQDASGEENLSKKELKKLEKLRKKELKSQNKKRGGFLKLVLFFIIILGAIYALLYFNVFNIRSNYIDGVIQGTPAEKLFPVSSTEGGTTGTSSSKADLVTQINDLNKQVEELTVQLADAEAKNELYVSQIDQLQPLVDEQVQFKADKEEFDKMIAENNPEAYKTFYKSMYPETAQEEYAKIVSAQESGKEISDYVSRFTAMDEDKAAGILEVMTVTDLNLVVTILENMSAEKSGAILAAMTPETAASVAKRMAPANY